MFYANVTTACMQVVHFLFACSLLTRIRRSPSDYQWYEVDNCATWYGARLDPETWKPVPGVSSSCQPSPPSPAVVIVTAVVRPCAFFSRRVSTDRLAAKISAEYRKHRNHCDRDYYSGVFRESPLNESLPAKFLVLYKIDYVKPASVKCVETIAAFALKFVLE